MKPAQFDQYKYEAPQSNMAPLIILQYGRENKSELLIFPLLLLGFTI